MVTLFIIYTYQLVKADASSSIYIPGKGVGNGFPITNIILYTEVHTMVVQHNMSAMNANRMLNGITSSTVKVNREVIFRLQN